MPESQNHLDDVTKSVAVCGNERKTDLHSTFSLHLSIGREDLVVMISN